MGRDEREPLRTTHLRSFTTYRQARNKSHAHSAPVGCFQDATDQVDLTFRGRCHSVDAVDKRALPAIG